MPGSPAGYANETDNVSIWGDNAESAKVENVAAIELDDSIETEGVQALSRAVQMNDIIYKQDVGFRMALIRCLGPLCRLSAFLCNLARPRLQPCAPAFATLRARNCNLAQRNWRHLGGGP